MEFAEKKVKEDLLVVTKKEKDGSSGICIHMCGDKDCVVCGLLAETTASMSLKTAKK